MACTCNYLNEISKVQYPEWRIPELGISQHCIEIEMSANYHNRIPRLRLELVLAYSDIIHLCENFKCDPVDLPEKMDKMIITNPIDGRKYIITKDGANLSPVQYFYKQRRDERGVNRIVLKLDYAE